jgi:peptidoglycan/LPS O-acetylase OafA/YrhL
LRNDLSYGVYIYAWPMQQLLAVCGLVVLPPPVFFVIATACTVPLAAASWFTIEKRALLLRHRIHVDGARRQRLRRWAKPVGVPRDPGPT